MQGKGMSGEVRNVTRIERWRKANAMTYEDLGNALGVKLQTALRYCLPISHKHHRRPGRDPSDNMRVLTQGECHAGNYADELDLATGEPSSTFSPCAGCDTASACRERGLCAWANLSTENTQPAKKDAA